MDLNLADKIDDIVDDAIVDPTTIDDEETILVDETSPLIEDSAKSWMSSKLSSYKKFYEHEYFAPIVAIIVILIVILIIVIVVKTTDGHDKFVGYQVASDFSGDMREPAFLSNRYANQYGSYNP